MDRDSICTKCGHKIVCHLSDMYIHDCSNFIDEKLKLKIQSGGHGRWVDKWAGKYDNPWYICSVCSQPALLEDYKDELGTTHQRQKLSDYCPHCGVIMNSKRDIRCYTCNWFDADKSYCKNPIYRGTRLISDVCNRWEQRCCDG